jgi:hypothetical protein
MKKIIAKWLGLPAIEKRISDLNARHEYLSNICMRLEQRIVNLGSVINVAVDIDRKGEGFSCWACVCIPNFKKTGEDYFSLLSIPGDYAVELQKELERFRDCKTVIDKPRGLYFDTFNGKKY